MTRPAVPEVEEAVLGGLLLAPERLPEVQAILGPDAFTEPAHVSIYSAMLAVADAGDVVDRLTVQAELERRDLLDASGGVAYLAGLDVNLPDLGRLTTYAAALADLAQRRRVADAAARFAGNWSDDNALATLREALDTSDAQNANSARVWILSELLADPEAVALPDPLIPRLAWPGRATLLAAEEKLGKSTLATAAVGAVTTGRPWLGETTSGMDGVVLWATEEHPGDVARRLTQFKADPASVVVMQWGADPIAEIQQEAEARRATLVVVDSLAALAEHARPESGSASDWAAIMRPLVRLARETGAAVVILHHARRIDGKYRDSSEIGAAVDVIAEMSGAATGTLRRVSWRGRYGRGSYSVRLAGDTFELAEDGADTADTASAILDYVGEHSGCGSTAIRDNVPGRAREVLAVLAQLVGDGRIVDRGTANRHRYHVAETRSRDENGRERTPQGVPTVPAVPPNGNGDLHEVGTAGRPPIPVSPPEGERVGTGTPERSDP